ncbi:MAG: hypothetical protein IT577_13295 [Verrucomicrobiae bacterium]|nr:hypothetical protein [Verrucomicrobiae bacterium]
MVFFNRPLERARNVIPIGGRGDLLAARHPPDHLSGWGNATLQFHHESPLVGAGWHRHGVGWFLGGVIMAITIIGIPFGIQHLKLAGISQAPLGKAVTVE